MSLLNKAKEYQVRYKRNTKKPTIDEIECVLAWLDGKITLNQLQYAFEGKTTGSGFLKGKILRIMKGMYDSKILIIKGGRYKLNKNIS
jgi:hypothetical protein